MRNRDIRGSVARAVVVYHATALQHQDATGIHHELIDAQQRLGAEPHLGRGAKVQADRRLCASADRVADEDLRGRRQGTARARNLRVAFAAGVVPTAPAGSTAWIRCAAKHAPANPPRNARRGIRFNIDALPARKLRGNSMVVNHPA